MPKGATGTTMIDSGICVLRVAPTPTIAVVAGDAALASQATSAQVPRGAATVQPTR